MSTVSSSAEYRVADEEAKINSRKSAHHQVVIVGGGTGGITVAARLTKGWFNRMNVAVIDPSAVHYYQPAWTLVGGGTYRLDATRRMESSVIPRKVQWIQERVTEFHPEENFLLTDAGTKVTYDWLVVAAGIQIHWEKVRGLRENVGKHGICSNYSFETVGYTWECIRTFQGGVAIFTQPAGAIKEPLHKSPVLYGTF